jgi:hypothetical protein
MMLRTIMRSLWGLSLRLTKVATIEDNRQR